MKSLEHALVLRDRVRARVFLYVRYLVHLAEFCKCSSTESTKSLLLLIFCQLTNTNGIAAGPFGVSP